MANKPPEDSSATPPEPVENRLCFIGNFADLHRILMDLSVSVQQVVSVALEHRISPGDGSPQTKFTVTYRRN